MVAPPPVSDPSRLERHCVIGRIGDVEIIGQPWQEQIETSLTRVLSELLLIDRSNGRQRDRPVTQCQLAKNALGGLCFDWIVVAAQPLVIILERDSVLGTERSLFVALAYELGRRRNGSIDRKSVV